MAKWNMGKLGWFLGGVAAGTAGVAILTSKDAKKFYTHCTAAVLRGKDQVMKQVNLVRENCEDIAQDAALINEERAAKCREQEIADAAEEIADTAAEAVEEIADAAGEEAQS